MTFTKISKYVKNALENVFGISSARSFQVEHLVAWLFEREMQRFNQETQGMSEEEKYAHAMQAFARPESETKPAKLDNMRIIGFSGEPNGKTWRVEITTVGEVSAEEFKALKQAALSNNPIFVEHDYGKNGSPMRVTLNWRRGL